MCSSQLQPADETVKYARRYDARHWSLTSLSCFHSPRSNIYYGSAGQSGYHRRRHRWSRTGHILETERLRPYHLRTIRRRVRLGTWLRVRCCVHSTEAQLTSFSIQRNGLQVLAKVPGLLDCVQGGFVDEWHYYSAIEEDKGFLGKTDHPKRRRELDGLGVISCLRSLLQQNFIDFAEKAGVPVHWGHRLETLTQNDDSVTAEFSNGKQASFDFVVGCDGIRSRTATCLFGEQPATYTGITRVRRRTILQ